MLKMRKVLTLVSLFSTVVIFFTASFAVWANLPKTRQDVQNAQPNSVIKISDINGLNDLRKLSESGENFFGKTIVLENDIYITKDQTKHGESIEFGAIFSKQVGFKGVFDGNGKTLLFNVNGGEVLGAVSEGGVVQNLNICGRFSGDVFTGILAFNNSGLIENCQIDAVVSNEVSSGVCGFCFQNDKTGIIRNCEVKGKLSTDCSSRLGMCQIGGICGANCGLIEFCKVSAELQSLVKRDEKDSCLPHAKTGGIAAFSQGIVRNCSVASDIINESEGEFYGTVGGLVSTNNGLIENSGFKGSIAAFRAGGVVGDNYTFLKSCKIDAKIKGQEAAEFSGSNMWGDESFYDFGRYCAAAEGKGPQGVVEDCEFFGSVDSADRSRIAVFENKSVNVLLDGKFVFFDPKITNCRTNGKLITREIDSYHTVAVGEFWKIGGKIVAG